METFDPLREQPLTFAQASKLDIIPQRRRGRPLHPSCIARWASQGLDGVRLEALKVGRTWCTSREALARFFHRLTASARREPSPTSPASNRQHHDAERTLERA